MHSKWGMQFKTKGTAWEATLLVNFKWSTGNPNV